MRGGSGLKRVGKWKGPGGSRCRRKYCCACRSGDHRFTLLLCCRSSWCVRGRLGFACKRAPGAAAHPPRPSACSLPYSPLRLPFPAPRKHRTARLAQGAAVTPQHTACAGFRGAWQPGSFALRCERFAAGRSRSRPPAAAPALAPLKLRAAPRPDCRRRGGGVGGRARTHDGHGGAARRGGGCPGRAAEDGAAAARASPSRGRRAAGSAGAERGLASPLGVLC